MPLSADILAMNEQLRNQFANFFNTGQEIVDYMIPSHRPITNQNAAGQKKTEKIFDSTAPESLFLVASFLSGALFNEAFQWFDIKHAREELNQHEESSEYFQAVRQVQLASLRQSNFYATPIELITDWLGFGNMCVLQERLEPMPPNYPRLVFTPVGFGSYVFFEGDDKRPEGLIREVDMSAIDCKRKFGDNCSERILTAAEKRPFEQIRIVHGIMPRKLISYRRLATPKDMPWASCWFEHGKKAEKPLLESGYYEKPFAIARYNVIAGEIMGRGLGELALPHVKTLNRIIMRGFLELDKALDPPTDSVQSNIIGSYSHRAGAVNILKRIEGTRVSEFAQQMRNRNATYEWNVNDLRTQIRGIFFTEQIRQLIGVMGAPVHEKTAFQYGKELELLHLIMAPTGGRLQSEGLRDIVETNYAINWRIGALPELPEVLAEAAKTEEGNKTVIVYEGPLAQSQRSQQIGTLREFLAGVGALAPLWQGVVDIPNINECVRKEAEYRGIQHLLHDPKKTNEIQQLKAKLQEAMAALAAAQQVSEIGKNAAPLITAMNGSQNGGQAKAA